MDNKPFQITIDFSGFCFITCPEIVCNLHEFVDKHACSISVSVTFIVVIMSVVIMWFVGNNVSDFLFIRDHAFSSSLPCTSPVKRVVSGFKEKDMNPSNEEI